MVRACSLPSMTVAPAKMEAITAPLQPASPDGRKTRISPSLA